MQKLRLHDMTHHPESSLKIILAFMLWFICLLVPDVPSKLPTSFPILVFSGVLTFSNTCAIS